MRISKILVQKWWVFSESSKASIARQYRAELKCPPLMTFLVSSANALCIQLSNRKKFMKEASFCINPVDLITLYLMEGDKEKIQRDESQEQLIELFVKGEAPETVVALASPGTGKSTTISRLVQALHPAKAQEREFLVLTFTKKTRSDLLRKLKKLDLSYNLKKRMISRIKNFHSLANDMLKWNNIIDDNEDFRFTKAFISDNKLQESESNLKKEIKRVKGEAQSRGYTMKEWEELLKDLLSHPRCRIIGEYFKKYLQWMESSYQKKKIITFNHAIVKATELIQKGQRPKKKVSYDINELELIVVDEFQDCNPAQLRMIEALLKRGKKCKLLLVGDFDQNIFTWRGVDISTIDAYLKSKIAFNSKYIKYLGNTYRLGQSLLDLSQKVINSNEEYKLFRNRFYKKYNLKARGQYDEQVQVRTFEREESEARWTIDQVYYYHFEKKIPLSQISILIRNMRNFRFTKLLINEIKKREKKIRYIHKQLTEILKSPNINYLMQILRYFMKRQGKPSQSEANVYQEIKIITYPIDRVGEKDQIRRKLIESGEIKIQSTEVLFYTDKHMTYKAERIRNWKLFMEDWSNIEDIVGDIDKIGFLQCCKRIFDVMRGVKWGDLDLDETKIEEFLEILKDVLQNLEASFYHKNPLLIITNYLISMSSNDDDEQLIYGNHNVLTIQTIHSCKGLQYRVVFISALNFKFPHWQKNNPFSILAATDKLEFADDDPVEKQKEEVRVIYTALTRSSQYCFVNSSIEFKKPDWLRYPKPHPIFQFIKKNVKFNQYVPYDPIKDRVDDNYLDQQFDLDKDVRRLERQEGQ